MPNESLGRRIFRDTASVSIINTAGQFIAYVMTAYVAATFGADWRTDALGLALTIPMFTSMVLRESVRSVLAPVLVELRVNQSPRLAQVAGQSAIAVLGASAVLALLLGLATPTITTLLGQGLTTEGQALLTRLSLELLPMLPLLCVAGAFGSILIAHGRFGLAAAFPAFDATIKIVVIALLASSIGIHSQAWGNVLGALAGAAALGVAAWRMGYLGGRRKAEESAPPETALSLPKAAVSESPSRITNNALRSMIYPLIGVSLLQLNPYIDRMMASGLTPGSVTALNYADKVAAIPYILFGAGFYPVILTHWSEVVASQGPRGLRPAMRSAISMGLYLLTPIVALMFTLRADLVTLLLQRGAFDAQATTLTSIALGFMVVAILPSFTSVLISRAFLALQNRRAPMWLGISNAALNVTLNLLLIGPLGLTGITLSTALTLAIVSVAGWLWLRRYVGPLGAVSLARPLLNILLASVACAVVAYLVASVIPGAGVAVLAVRLALGGSLGLLTYIGLTWVLRVEEGAKISYLMRSALRSRLARFGIVT